MYIEPHWVLHSQDHEFPPGRLADAKRGDISDPGYPQPQAAEVESARLLANDARQALHAAGLPDADIDRLADDFISEDRGEATEPFIDWPPGAPGRTRLGGDSSCTSPHSRFPAPRGEPAADGELSCSPWPVCCSSFTRPCGHGMTSPR